MMNESTLVESLQQEIARLRGELDEARDTLRAIMSGEIDALVMHGSDGPQVFTLDGAEQPYRLMIEGMHEGAVTVSNDGLILFSNQRFADMLGVPLEHVIGSPFVNWLRFEDRVSATMLLASARSATRESEQMLQRTDGALAPVYVSLSPVSLGDSLDVVCVAITDLTEQVAQDRKIRALQALQIDLYALDDIQSAYALVQRRICDELDWTLAELWFPDDDGQVMRASDIWYMRNADVEPFRAAAEALRYPAGVSIVGEAWQQRQPVWLTDSIVDPRYPRSQLAHDVGIRASVAIPVLVEQDVRAVLTFFMTERREVDDLFVRLITVVAEQLSAFIQRKQAEAALAASEERFRTLVQDSNTIIAIIDRDGHIAYMSESIKDVLGYTTQTMQITTVFASLHPQDRQGAEAMISNLVRTPGAQRSTELRVRHQDGTWRTLEVTLKNCLDMESIRGIVINARDITERKQFEDALLTSEERFRSLVQGSDDVITIVDTDGKILYESQSVERLLGYKVDELMFRSVFEGVHPDDEGRARALYDQLIAAPDDSITIEVRFQHRNGDWRVLEIAAKNYLDNPAIGGIVLNSRDITERRAIEAALRASEERYRLIVRATNDVIWDWNLTDDAIEWGESIYPVFGYTPDEALGSSRWWANRIHPDDRDVVEASIQAAQQGSEPFWFTEYRFMRADGQYATVTDQGYVIRNDAGEAIRMIGAMTDITQRTRAQAELRETLEELNRVLRQSTDIIGSANATHLLRVNDAFERILGFDRDESLSIPFLELIHEDDREASVRFLASLADSSRTPSKFENRFRCKDGSYRWIEWNTTPFQNDVLFFVGRDVTERIQAEAEVRTLNAELEHRVAERTAQLVAVNKELEAFSYSVSHDLRAPLRALDGFGHALLEDYGDLLPEEGHFFVERIRAGTQRMGQLIDDLLKLSRLTRDEMHLEAVDLSRLVCTIARELREMEPAREVEFVIADDLIAQGDARLLRAALYNLLANAWKFTSRRVDPRIEFGMTMQGGVPTFFVRDNGVGFDMAYADKLFGAFQRLHSQTEFEGTGVGLATVQRVIHRHGGTVWATGEPGVGATFYFQL